MSKKEKQVIANVDVSMILADPSGNEFEVGCQRAFPPSAKLSEVCKWAEAIKEEHANRHDALHATQNIEINESD